MTDKELMERDAEGERVETMRMLRQVVNYGAESVEEIGKRLRASERRCAELEAENDRQAQEAEALKTSLALEENEMVAKQSLIEELSEEKALLKQRIEDMFQRQDVFVEMVKHAWEKGLLVIMGERFFSFMRSLKPDLFATLSNSLHDSTPEFAPNQHNLLTRLNLQFMARSQQGGQTLNFNGSVGQVFGTADDVDIK